LKIHQYNALKFQTEIAKYLLLKKAYFQQETLRKLELPLIRITPKTIIEAKDTQTLLGVEGTLAKSYFGSYFTFFPKVLAKGARTKRPPLDPINAMLSYLYTILYYEIASWLVFYDFDPAISYLHQPFRHHLSLASDILEPLRPQIDLFVAELFKRGEIEPSMFTKQQGVYLKPTARKRVWNEIKPFLERTEPRIKKEISDLKEVLKNGLSSKPLQKWLSIKDI